MRRAKLIGLVILIIVLLTLIWQNRRPVETQILFMPVTMPVALLLFLTGAVGFVSGVLTCLLLMRKPRVGQIKGKDSGVPPAPTTPSTPPGGSASP